MVSVTDVLRESQGVTIRMFRDLLNHLDQVSKDFPHLDFNWWLPLAEERWLKEARSVDLQ